MYKITTHAGQEINLPTMGDVLHQLNTLWDIGANPYAGNVEHMSLQVEGLVYPIVHVQGYAIAPSFVYDFTAPCKHMARWIDEVAGYATGSDGSILKPHQIPRAQWLAITALSNVAYGVYQTFSVAQLNARVEMEGKHFDSLTHFFTTAFYQKFGYGHNGPQYHAGDTNTRHEVHVCYALAKGLDVPVNVLADYCDAAFSHDPPWFKQVVQKPFLRGAFRSVEQLDSVVSLLRDAKVEVTSDNVASFVELLGALAPDAGRIAVDNRLYEAGILTVRPQPPMRDIGIAFNSFAARHRIMLGQWRQQSREKALGRREDQKTFTLREYDWKKANISTEVERETFDWPNRVAMAIAEKNLPAMLSILDGAENETTKRAVEIEFNVKLRNVTAGERRRAIFAMAGFVDDEAYKAEEARLDALQKARKAEREFEDARNRASASKIRSEGGDLFTLAEYVEMLVRKGHTSIQGVKCGACRVYYLTNQQTSETYPLGRQNGTLDFARLLLERVAA